MLSWSVRSRSYSQRNKRAAVADYHKDWGRLFALDSFDSIRKYCLSAETFALLIRLPKQWRLQRAKSEVDPPHNRIKS
jgi:hypothetical protein